MKMMLLTALFILGQTVSVHAVESPSIGALKARCRGFDESFGNVQILIVSAAQGRTLAHLVVGLQTVAETEVTIESGATWDADEPAVLKISGDDFSMTVDPGFNTGELETSLNGKALSDNLSCEIFDLQPSN